MKNISETAEYFRFRLGKEVFAIEAFKIQEVLKLKSITPVPRLPDYLPGVVNVRGNVISVVDPGLFFGLKENYKKSSGWLVITEICIENRQIRTALLVDALEDVFRLDPSHIKPPPEIGIKIDTEFVHGIGHIDESYITIINIDRVIASMREGAGDF